MEGGGGGWEVVGGGGGGGGGETVANTTSEHVGLHNHVSLIKTSTWDHQSATVK